MDFTMQIGSESVEMSNNFQWMVEYKNQFKEDPAQFLFGTLAQLERFDPNDKRFNAVVMKAAGDIGSVRLANMAWAMAKLRDRDIPSPKTWNNSFKKFPIFEIGIDVLLMAVDSMVGSDDDEELKNAAAPAEALTPAEN